MPTKEEPMPIYHQKKCSTPEVPDSIDGQCATASPDQRAFQQHLRELARDGIRVALESVLREELDILIGVA